MISSKTMGYSYFQHYSKTISISLFKNHHIHISSTFSPSPSDLPSSPSDFPLQKPYEIFPTLFKNHLQSEASTFHGAFVAPDAVLLLPGGAGRGRRQAGQSAEARQGQGQARKAQARACGEGKEG